MRLATWLSSDFPALGIRKCSRFAGDDDAGRPEEPAVELVALLHDLRDRVWRLLGRRHHRHCFVEFGIECLARRLELDDTGLLERLRKQLQRGFRAGTQCVGGCVARETELETVF